MAKTNERIAELEEKFSAEQVEKAKTLIMTAAAEDRIKNPDFQREFIHSLEGHTNEDIYDAVCMLLVLLPAKIVAALAMASEKAAKVKLMREMMEKLMKGEDPMEGLRPSEEEEKEEEPEHQEEVPSFLKKLLS